MPPFHEDPSMYRRAILQDRSNSIKLQQQQQQLQGSNTELSRTQYKLQLQRLSFLTNDKNYLDHPHNMRRLTKELDRVNREYRNVRRFEDPVKESLKRLIAAKKSTVTTVDAQAINNTSLSSTAMTDLSNSSSNSSSYGSNSSGSLDNISQPPFSTSTDKSSFLTRWFIHQSDAAEDLESSASSVAYSFHPTIASQMKRRTKN